MFGWFRKRPNEPGVPGHYYSFMMQGITRCFCLEAKRNGDWHFSVVNTAGGPRTVLAELILHAPITPETVDAAWPKLGSMLMRTSQRSAVKLSRRDNDISSPYVG